MVIVHVLGKIHQKIKTRDTNGLKNTFPNETSLFEAQLRRCFLFFTINLWLAKWCKIHIFHIHSHLMISFLFTSTFIDIKQLRCHSTCRHKFTFTDIFLSYEYIHLHSQHYTDSFIFKVMIFIQHLQNSQIPYSFTLND